MLTQITNIGKGTSSFFCMISVKLFINYKIGDICYNNEENEEE